jgi:Iap family predicted aminopeptidase
VKLPAPVLDALGRTPVLMRDLAALADCGGRFAGSPSEDRARHWLLARLAAIVGASVTEHRFPYTGWRQHGARIEVPGSADAPLAAHALIRSPSTPEGGLEGDVIDVGRGTDADFDRVARDLAGNIALVRHEYPFAADTIHRRVKYGRSRDAGAAGFVIGNNLPDAGLVTGSSGEGGPGDIPAMGISYEDALRLGHGTGHRRRVRLHIGASTSPAQAANVVVDLPGQEPERVVLTAHYDGHDLAESALDNATGTAAVITIVEALARAGRLRRGLRAILFTTEEWRLLGSEVYVDGLSEAERRQMVLNVNLDTLSGGSTLACLTSGFDHLGPFVSSVAAEVAAPVRLVPTLLRNSDHYNFARHGIPALRLVAGFDEPDSRVRYLLTSADTRDKVVEAELRNATVLGAALVWSALQEPGPLRSPERCVTP